jgi:hypothetical protein
MKTFTEEEALKIAACAVNASIPMGLGLLHFKPKSYTPEDMKGCMNSRGGLYIDYFEGRMVKLEIRREPDGSYSLLESVPAVDYQSWASKYPTYSALAFAALEKEL